MLDVRLATEQGILCAHGHYKRDCQGFTRAGKEYCKLFRQEARGENSTPRLSISEVRNYQRLRKAGAAMTLTGSKEDTSLTYARVTFVCGHKEWFRRAVLDPTAYDMEFMCDGCNSKPRKIHEISARYRGWPGLVLFPLNRVERFIWPHVKNAGYGRA